MKKILAALILFLSTQPQLAFCCSVCFGNFRSQETKAVIAGMITLLLVIGGVLGGILTAGIKMAIRSKKLSKDPGPAV